LSHKETSLENLLMILPDGLTSKYEGGANEIEDIISS
jgi:hypothetical protein